MVFKAPSTFAENSPKVVVIGAGLAGLTAAHRLGAAGMDVALYEARNRVGGRVLTVQLNNEMVELGAQTFTNLSKHPHLCHLIKEFGLETIENTAALGYLYFDGKNFIPISQLFEKLQFEPSTFHHKLTELKTHSSNIKEILESALGEDSPLAKALATKLAIYEGAPLENLSTHYIETLSYFFAEALSSQTKQEEELYINRCSIKGGNGLLPEKMASPLGTRLKFNHRLVQVSKNPQGIFTLTFEGGLKVQTDLLVLAIPCSVYASIDFEENVISFEQLQAIKSVKYGTNSKILTPLYDSSVKTMGLVIDQIYSQFDSRRGILTTHFTEDADSCFEETLTNICDLARPAIERVFAGQSFDRPLPAEDRSFVSYNSPISYSWLHDPYAKGSYSYIAAGQETILNSITEDAGEKFKTLFAPLQGLYFTGEHTSISAVPATMEAACEAGERTARTILKKHTLFSKA